jgi:23S rRNA (cytosine1962-C5)-methyltransferase
MDPPAFGHGPAGEKWDFGNNFPELLEMCRRLLADKPTLLLINAYAVSQSGIGLGNALEGIFDQGQVECGELALVEASGRRLLSTGKFARGSN